MNDEEKQMLQHIKDSALMTCDTLDVIFSAITSETIKLTSLLSPIELLNKEIMDNIVMKIDQMLNI